MRQPFFYMALCYALAFSNLKCGKAAHNCTKCIITFAVRQIAAVYTKTESHGKRIFDRNRWLTPTGVYEYVGGKNGDLY